MNDTASTVDSPGEATPGPSKRGNLMKTAMVSTRLFRRRCVGLLAGTLATLLLGSAPAFAGELTAQDPSGDMQKSIGWDEDPDSTYQSAPRRRQGDIVRARFRHTNTNVVVKARFAELKRGNPDLDLWDLFVAMKDQDGTKYDVFLSAGGYGNRRGNVQVFGPRRELKCSTRHKIDYEMNTVRLVIPRTCLHDPRSVRFRVGVFLDTYDTALEKSIAYVDRLDGDSVSRRGWTSRMRRG
jgi:hypothetical protein